MKKKKKPFLRRILNFSVRLFYDSQEFVYLRRPLGDIVPIIKGHHGLAVRPGDAADLDALAELVGEKKRRLFSRRLDAGHDLFCGLVDRIIVAYMWVATRPYHEPCHNIFLPLKDDEIYQFDGWVHPERRGRELANFSLISVYQHYLELGRRWTVAYCRNDPSTSAYRLHRRLGFKAMARIRYRRVLGFKRSSFLPFAGEL